MDEYEVFVRAQFAQVGSVVLYPALHKAVSESPHNVDRLHIYKRRLIDAGFLSQQVIRNPTTGEMEHRLTRLV